MKLSRRCMLHGGQSTGPRTREGLERMQQSKIKHGRYTKEMKAAIQRLKIFRATLARLKKDAHRCHHNLTRRILLWAWQSMFEPHINSVFLFGQVRIEGQVYEPFNLYSSDWLPEARSDVVVPIY